MPNRNKERDMARSLLPSTRRDWAKWKGRLINRQARRAIKQFIQVYNPEEGDDSDLVNGIGWAERNRQQRQRRRVRNRQDGDKLGAFIRWGKSKTKSLPDNEAKYYAVKSMLGADNVITQHAITHWEQVTPLNPRKYRYWAMDRKKQEAIVTREFFEQCLREAFELCHKEVNQVLKGSEVERRKFYFQRHTYKKCKHGEDECMVKWVHRRRVYVYHIPLLPWERRMRISLKGPVAPPGFKRHESEQKTHGYGNLKRRPVDSYIKETTHEKHDTRKCDNLVLINHPDDVKKVSDYFFQGWKKPKTVIYKSRMAGHKEKTVMRLMELFRRKGIIQ